MLWY